MCRRTHQCYQRALAYFLPPASLNRSHGKLSGRSQRSLRSLVYRYPRSRSRTFLSLSPPRLAYLSPFDPVAHPRLCLPCLLTPIGPASTPVCLSIPPLSVHPLAYSQDIRSLWPEAHNPFYAGFGNRASDVVAYKEAGVPPARIMVVNPQVTGPTTTYALLRYLMHHQSLFVHS